jgi:ABC-type Fe3+/spermidine/putrescine transport system ATPase subunit
LLQIQELSKYYENERVVNAVSFTVNKGEILAIVGESGSGKTTLLNMISGNIRPDAGSLLLNNELIDLYFNRLIRELPDIKLVPQDYRLKPDFKIWENIDLALTEYNSEYRQKRVAYLLELCGITQIKDKKPREASGGEKQRTAIARSIADEPLVLLLDEPFSNLDSINRQHLRNQLITIIQKEDIACVFVTHDMIEALLVADKVAVMHKGDLLKIATPDEIFHEKENAYIQQFVQSAIEPLNAFKAKFH